MLAGYDYTLEFFVNILRNNRLKDISEYASEVQKRREDSLQAKYLCDCVQSAISYSRPSDLSQRIGKSADKLDTLFTILLFGKCNAPYALEQNLLTLIGYFDDRDRGNPDPWFKNLRMKQLNKLAASINRYSQYDHDREGALRDGTALMLLIMQSRPEILETLNPKKHRAIVKLFHQGGRTLDDDQLARGKKILGASPLRFCLKGDRAAQPSRELPHVLMMYSYGGAS